MALAPKCVHNTVFQLKISLYSNKLVKVFKMCRTVRTKKVYRPRHAERKAKAYKRDKFNNHLNPLDYVCDPDNEV